MNQTRFVHTLEAVGVTAADAGQTWRRLEANYDEAHRAYHTLEHIRAMLAWLDTCGEGTPAMELAIWFHDSVYDPKSATNEADSAALFMELAGRHLPPDFAADVCRLILATDHRTPRTSNPAEALLIDIDLSILGAEPEAYTAYSRAIRREYAHVPDEPYRAGRSAVLEHFLRRPIFATERFRPLEAAARVNLAGELTALLKNGPV
jgi:predicted metal-dependent HD superfamily phosphohydrolase